MRLGFPVFLVSVLGALLACSPDPDRENFDYFRSPILFRADTTLSFHPFCERENPLGSVDACRGERKYRLTWERPTDTARLKGYRIYLDTARDDKHWSTIRNRPEMASIILNRFPPKDSVVFIFTSTPRATPDTLDPGEERLVSLDSVGRAEPGTGRLMFALVPVYEGGVTPGKPLFADFVTTDRKPPDVFSPRFRALSHGFSVAWQRPTDRVSEFNPSMDTGIISGYVLEVALGGRPLPSRNKSFQPKLLFYRKGDSAVAARDSTVLKDGLPSKVLYFLPDGRRSAKHIHPDITDSMFLEVGNLFPRDTLELQLWALDSAGNSNDTSMETISLRTTDTTQPSAPELGIDSLGQNGFIITWAAARDSVPGPGGALIEAERPNANIMDYRLRRVLLRDSGQKATSLDLFDTIVQVDSNLAKRSQFRLPVRFLPPGASYHISLFAEDSTGYPSRTDTLTVTTRKVVFADSDSVLACPPGFIPVPRGKFTLGDRKGEADENPARPVAMAPFCIEPYEHRDSTGQRFMSNVTFEQAEAICREIDSTGYDTRLCSEAEWERACEGPAPDSLLHGIQSEGKDPSILQTSCNQSTNDSAMAMNFALRNPVCLTTEGVYDMAGNLSEWVRDTYVPGAYASLTGDTARLDHGFVFADSGRNSLHVVRGGNYLRPNLTQLSARQSLARCSNRDIPAQVRPKFRDDCVTKEKPMLAVIYGPGVNGHRCQEPKLKEGHSIADVTELVPAPRDTFAVLAFIRDLPRPDTIRLDTVDAFRGRKPLAAVFTSKTLAAVTFERVLPVSGGINAYDDTLDATEIRDTSEAGLGAILQREAANPAWTVRKRDGKFAVEYLYAYSILGSKPARPFYSSRLIGFRCCSQARKPVAPADSIASIR